jgi:uncharacterized protein (TIGR00375 family)
MKVFTDFHIHSRFSRGTSKNITIENLSNNAEIKGIDILGSGDFTHPRWLEELKQKLSDNGSGIYEYDTNFILSGEISLMYQQDGSRRIHHLLLAPSFEIVDQINEFLDTKGRRDYDGRPIFGFSSIELVEEMMKISKQIMIIPCHILTPWFSIFGSKSGFNSVEECFKEKSKYIHALETGLSSDISMDRRISSIDRLNLVSFSDAHSYHPWRLGREATILELKKISYNEIFKAIQTDHSKKLSTIEVPVELGKYHIDGHRSCNFCSEPKQTAKLKGICPVCKRNLTIGVLNRVEELADRQVPKNPQKSFTLLPLAEILSLVYGVGVQSKTIAQHHARLIKQFGNEFEILLKTDLNRLDNKLAYWLKRNREGTIKIKPGYDGVYGEPVMEKEASSLKNFV